MMHREMSNDSLRMHRDVLQWSRPIVTVLVYLEKSGVENGCTHVIPASHYAPFVSSGERTGGTWMDEHEQFADLFEQALPVPMRARSALVLDANVFHAPSLSSHRTRMTIALAYRSIDELDAHAERQRAVLVSGNYIYRGNDVAAPLRDVGRLASPKQRLDQGEIL
jgi:ectoine hydroxylase-related dioxygenase (phytanoyl-CoA dioxygenase family)